MRDTFALKDGCQLLLTGATGFLGSHILRSWLERSPSGQVVCPVRGRNPVERLGEALRGALRDAGSNVSVEDLLQRIKVVAVDLVSKEKLKPALGRVVDGQSFDVIHGAANLSFREDDRDAVFSANVEGTRNMLEATLSLPGIRSFNYISTAYVAGRQSGRIRELDNTPRSFNNAYEESKWVGEQLVRGAARKTGIESRIFRPSIVIGHSSTYLSSSNSGFYKVVEMLYRLAALRSFERSVSVPSCPNASLNLIPVDIVVNEMLDIMSVRTGGEDAVYHLTNERPLSVEDILFGISPMTGVVMECHYGSAHEIDDSMDSVLKRNLQFYLPYFRQDLMFDRRNVHACHGEERDRYWLDLVRLRRFVDAFLKGVVEKVERREKIELREVAGA